MANDKKFVAKNGLETPNISISGYGEIVDSNGDWTGTLTQSQNIVYTPAGTGAVDTTVQTKLRETVSPTDFGAVGDGVTDDTAALKAMVEYVFSVSTALDTSLRKGHVKVEFPSRREYKITDTIDFGGSIGVAGQQGCRVNIDFNNCQILPAPDISGVVHSALRLWGQNATWQNLTIDFGVYCTQHEVYTHQPAGIVMNPLEANVPASGVIFSFCTYQQIIVFDAWIGFYLEPNTAPSFKNRFINCDAKGCLNWGYKMDSTPTVGISTTNVWECCHVAAKLVNSDVANGGAYYNCIQTHVPSAATEPGVGVDWETVWIENPVTNGAGYPAWDVNETRYYEDGKGYYLYALSNSTFQGGCAVDGTNNNENGNMITVDNQGGLVIMGGFHIEGYLSVSDNKYPIDVRRGYLIADELYFPGSYWMAPTENVLIGSSLGQARRVFLQDYHNYAPIVQNSPIRVINVTGINFVKTGMGVASDEVIGTPDNGALIERRIVSRDMYEQLGQNYGGSNSTVTPQTWQSGTTFAHNVGLTGSFTLNLTQNPETGSLFKARCFNSTSAISGGRTSDVIVTTTDNAKIFGPRIAKEGETLVAYKAGNSFWYTHLEYTQNYGSTFDTSIADDKWIGDVKPQVFDIQTDGLPSANVYKDYIIQVLNDSAYPKTFAVSDGTDWIRINDLQTVNSAIQAAQSQTFADGTESSPSITFTNDNDTGLYRIGDNSFGVTVGGQRYTYWDGTYTYFNNVSTGHTRMNKNSMTLEFNTNTFQDTACLFQFNGTQAGAITIQTDNTTVYGVSSDYRLKENITLLDSALDRINKIPVRRFNMINGSGRTVDGFLAHEVQQHVPEAVVGEKDEVDVDGNPKYQMIDQSKLVPLLVASIQELKQRVEQLEQQLGN